MNMRDLINLIENLQNSSELSEATTLSAGEITKYPERFDAFINHIQSRRPFYTADGAEVTLDPNEAERFLQLKADDKFSGGLKGRDLEGNDWPLSKFLKTSEFGGTATKPGEEGDITKVSKEAAPLKPTSIKITDKNIPAGQLGALIVQNPILESTPYGQAVIQMAQQIMAGEPAVIPEEYRKMDAIKKAIVDYAGEYLGVLALVSGQSAWYGGDKTKQEFLKWLGGDLDSLIVNFPSKTNTQLADSFATVSNASTGHTLNISSKGTGGGAAPSLSGIKVPAHLRNKESYKTAIDIIDLCSNKKLPAPGSVSQVFLMMNLLNEQLPETIPARYKKFLPWDMSIVPRIKDSLKKKTPMPEYEELFRDLDSKGSDGGKLTYVTKKTVMEIINGGAVPEFESVVLEVLDYNFIQQYATYKGNKSGVIEFATQWPAKLDGEVSIETKSGATDPSKGSFSFKLHPKGQAVKTDAGPVPGTETSATPGTAAVAAEPDDLDAVAQKRSGVKASSFNEPEGNKQSLGRARR